MMWIVRLALRRPYTFAVFALLILILGAYSIASMPTDIFPNIDIPVVTVVWNYTGLSAQEMSTRIIFNSERGVTTTVSDVEHIESQSLNGIGVIKIFFQPHVNIGNAVAQVTAISQVQLRSLPPGTTPPFIIQYNASSVPVLMLGLSGHGLSEQQLNDLGHQHDSNPAGHRRGSADTVTLWRKAAPDPGGHRSKGAAGPGIVARRCGERGLSAEPDCALGHDEDGPVRVCD